MSSESAGKSEGAGQDQQNVKFSLPVPVHTLVLLGGIFAAFAAQLYVGANSEQAYAAAFDKPQFRYGAYWLILTGAAIHGGVLHVFMNSYALFSFGGFIELLSNRAHVGIVFLLSVLGGGFLSYLYDPNGRSVGASGGVVGLIAYLAVYAFKRRKFIAPRFRRDLVINIGFILIFGLVLFDVIDNAAHIGGLLAGAAYGFVQIPADEYVDPRAAGKGVEILGIVCLGIYLAACVFSILITLGLT